MTRLKIILIIFVFFEVSLSFHCFAQENTQILDLYDTLKSDDSKPNYDVFEKAMLGYNKLKKEKKTGNKKILTIIDLSISSNIKRMWVIDLGERIIVYNTLVSHGKNSGNEFAQGFSNTFGSHKSSLGFFITGKTYIGKHGLSLYLDGMEKGINDNARKRSIVMHGADYVSKSFSKKHGRLGRSFGCPAIPMEKRKEIIKLLENKTCLFIYYPDKKYLNTSKLINYDK